MINKIILSASLIVSSLISLSQNSKKHNTSDSLKTFTLFSKAENVSCFRIPSLVTAPNGDLIAAIDERVPSCNDLRGNPDINIVIRRSSDNGEIWSDIEKVIDYPYGKSASDPSMIVDRVTGKIFLFFNYMDLNNEKDTYYLKVIRSEDNGKTWSKPTDITRQITKPAWQKDFMFITSGRGFQTSTGKLLHTLVNIDKGVFLFMSDDHGNSWNLIDSPLIPGDESKVIELSDGSWLVNSRISNEGFRYIHKSFDKGKTWVSAPDSLLIDPGCNASILSQTININGVRRNILLFSNPNDKKNRKNLTIRFSSDEGKTWSEGRTIYKDSSAYSSMTILKNGKIGLLFEANNYSKVVFISFPIEWLINN